MLGVLTIVFWVTLACVTKSADFYDMTPAEPKIRVVVSCDEQNPGHKQMIKTALELQKSGFNVLIQAKKRAKLKTVVFIGRDAKQETIDTLTKEQIVDWIYTVAIGKPIPEKSIFKSCTEDCPEGTCETVKEDEEQQYVEPQRRIRIFRR